VLLGSCLFQPKVLKPKVQPKVLKTDHKGNQTKRGKAQLTPVVPSGQGPMMWAAAHKRFALSWEFAHALLQGWSFFGNPANSGILFATIARSKSFAKVSVLKLILQIVEAAGIKLCCQNCKTTVLPELQDNMKWSSMLLLSKGSIVTFLNSMMLHHQTRQMRLVALNCQDCCHLFIQKELRYMNINFFEVFLCKRSHVILCMS
jgi:hypothetical protein